MPWALWNLGLRVGLLCTILINRLIIKILVDVYDCAVVGRAGVKVTLVPTAHFQDRARFAHMRLSTLSQAIDQT
jgi:hypothetical protein